MEHEYTKGFEMNHIKKKLRGLEAQAELQNFFLKKRVDSDSDSDSDLERDTPVNRTSMNSRRAS